MKTLPTERKGQIIANTVLKIKLLDDDVVLLTLPKYSPQREPVVSFAA